VRASTDIAQMNVPLNSVLLTTAARDPHSAAFMGAIDVHELMTLDGVIDAPAWTFDYLFVYPLTRGSGPQLLPEGAPPRKLSLAAANAYDNGVVYGSYRPQAAEEQAQA
jgi:hypothetical protein